MADSPNPREPVIVEAVRTPVGRRNGALKDVHAQELGAVVLNEVTDRAGVDPGDVEDVIFGCVTQVNEQSTDVARLALLAAGWPFEVAGTTVDRQCGSGLQAVNFAAGALATNQADIIVAGGVEHMTRVPMGSNMSSFDDLHPTLFDRFEVVTQGIAAEKIAAKWDLDREALDRFSLESHEAAVEAIDAGHFKKETVPVETPDGLFETDEHPRRDTSMEALAKLSPAFDEDGVVTAGNSSGINDGAAAVMVTTRQVAEERGLPVRARFRSFAVTGSHPTIMLMGPVPATNTALERAGLSLSDLDAVEINEAFASVVVACGKELGFDPHDRSFINPNGGAVALGHPLGCTGAKLLTTLLHHLERNDQDLGLVTMCIGMGQGIATIVERET